MGEVASAKLEGLLPTQQEEDELRAFMAAVRPNPAVQSKLEEAVKLAAQPQPGGFMN